MTDFLAAFQTLWNPVTIGLMIMGTAVGILFGAMPGMSATLAVAVFLPLTFNMDVSTAFPMLIALYIGGVSGGLISAILINIPGTPSSVATTFDGVPMAKKGDGAKALGAGVVFSFIGTIFSIFALIFIAPILAKAAIRFGPYEYFAVTGVSLLLIAGLAGKSMLKGILSALLGMTAGMVGIAPVVGTLRFTFGLRPLAAGFSMVPLLVGLFALPELLRYARKDIVFERAAAPKIKGFGFSLAEFKGQTVNWIRSALIGLGIGILPGIGGATSNMLAYAVAKNSSKTPEKFGEGILDGIVAPETANNASIGGAMIPLLSLGIPGDGTTALLLGALTLQGITAGPLFFTTNRETGYLIFVALFVASIMMIVMEFAGMRIFVKLLNIPLNILLPIIMVICAIGSFTATNTILSIWVFLGFGLVGYLLSEFDVPLSPMVLGYVLGGTNELYLFRGLQMTRGNFLPFVQSPIAAGIMAVGLIYVLFKVVRSIQKAVFNTKKQPEKKETKNNGEHAEIIE